MNISYFVIEKNKTVYAPLDIDAEAMFIALKVLPIPSTQGSEVGIIVQSYSKKDSLPDLLLVFTIRDNSLVAVIPWKERHSRSLRWMIRHLWDSNDIRKIIDIIPSERPNTLSLNEKDMPKDLYPFITLTMKWPSEKFRYEYSNCQVRCLVLPKKRRIDNKKLAIATLTATALLVGTYYFYNRNSNKKFSNSKQDEKIIEVEINKDE